ncbi:MAG: hypothetical protein Q8922_03390 [Bacteroidota bacterium]|nr:hypothetical protein [Bacteroidota bacterium]MDP4233334.1 hypothetical protein [Bacteroidota bacterium]MDP4244188.1 hypothetical protein [Bacteroidota bacterium]MDP4286957.1 hypothetical protein [Bacteroidota bacterium]
MLGLFLLACSLCISSCSSSRAVYKQYSADDDKIGYVDALLTDSTYEVKFRGGDCTEAAVNNGAMYRCAELTTNKGYDYFVILRDTIEQEYQFQGWAPTNYGGTIQNRPYNVYYPVGVKAFSVGKGATPNRSGAFNAKDVMVQYASKIIKPGQ